MGNAMATNKKLIFAMLSCALALSANAAVAQTVVYIHTDALGTPVVMTDANRNVIERSEYEPYGKVLNRPLRDGPGYTGHLEDAATGLSYMQQRYYDPDLGRFLSVDPVSAETRMGGNFNRYKYASNNPFFYTDPDGRYDCEAQDDQCAQTRRAMSILRRARLSSTGNARIVLNNVVRLLGTEGDGNGVVIRDTTDAIGGGWMNLQKGGVLSVNFASVNASAASRGKGVQDFMVASVIAHEGWHGSWDKLTYAAGVNDPWSRSFAMDNERRASITEGIVAQAIQFDHPQGFWTRKNGFDMKPINKQAAESVAIYCAALARTGLPCSN